MRSRVARCLASKAVVVCAGPPLSRNENGKKPGCDGGASLAGGGPGLAAGACGAAPDLGCGAGVGSGTFSADAAAMASAVHSVAARIVVARRPAIVFSCCTEYARRNPLIARYGEFAATVPIKALAVDSQ